MHTIRLRGPWECEPLRREDDFTGEVLLRRRFNRPTGLEDRARVWLVIEEVAAAASVMLNQQTLGGILPSGQAPGLAHASSPLPCPVHFQITSLLRPHNLIEIIVHSPVSTPLPSADSDGPGRFLGPVRLEIDSGE